MSFCYGNSLSGFLLAHHRHEDALNKASPVKGINRVHGSTRASESHYRFSHHLVRTPITGGIPKQRSIDSDGIDLGTHAVHSGFKRTLRVMSNAAIDKVKRACLA
jgi:hypothetical protein